MTRKMRSLPRLFVVEHARDGTTVVRPYTTIVEWHLGSLAWFTRYAEFRSDSVYTKFLSRRYTLHVSGQGRVVLSSSSPESLVHLFIYTLYKIRILANWGVPLEGPVGAFPVLRLLLERIVTRRIRRWGSFVFIGDMLALWLSYVHMHTRHAVEFIQYRVGIPYRSRGVLDARAS